MSLFDYLTVAVSIVLALGLARLIDGLRLASGSLTRYWVHLGYVIIALVLHLVVWWRLWGFREGVDWDFGLFVFVFIGPMLLYSLASTLVPDDPNSVTSWRDHFYRVHRAFFLAWAGLTVQQFMGPIALQGILPRLSAGQSLEHSSCYNSSVRSRSRREFIRPWSWPFQWYS